MCEAFVNLKMKSMDDEGIVNKHNDCVLQEFVLKCYCILTSRSVCQPDKSGVLVSERDLSLPICSYALFPLLTNLQAGRWCSG